MVKSVTLCISTHLAKFVSSARSNFLPRVHFALYLLFRFCCTGCPVIFGPLSLSLLIVKCHQVGPAGLMVRLDKESIVYPAIHNASRAHTHIYIYIYTRCVVRAIRCVTRGCIAYIGRHAIVAPSNVNKYRGRSFRILDTNNRGKFLETCSSRQFSKLSVFPFFPLLLSISFPFCCSFPSTYPSVVYIIRSVRSCRYRAARKL